MATSPLFQPDFLSAIPRRPLLSAGLAAAALALSGCSTLPPALTCGQLSGLTVAQNQIELPTSGALVTSAETVAATGSGIGATGQFCKVLGEIKPVDPMAPPIRFQLNLPAGWNGKALMYGGGGFNGVLHPVASGLSHVLSGPTDRQTPLSRGYATFGSDSGHTAKPPMSFGRDGSFAVNDEALTNYASDALKKTRDVAGILIRNHYRADPKKTYFQGGSTGGREALAVIQRWPKDFDGAISIFPAWNGASLNLAFGKIARALDRPGAWMSGPKRKLLYDAGVAACDGLDGLLDGIISNVAACNATIDPDKAMVGGKPLRCPGGADTGDGCLSDAQIAAINTIAGATTFQFPLASGETGYPGFNVWGGDLGIPSDQPELAASPLLGLNKETGARPVSPDMPFALVFFDQWMRYFVARDAGFDSLSVDPERPGPWAARISALSAMQDFGNADLSAFQSRGGKLLMMHGTADMVVSNRATAQYYERLQQKMGSETVRGFARYYEVPGYSHTFGRAFNASWDPLAALEEWAEKGTAPTNLTVTDKSVVKGRTRPLCDYPGWPKYKGYGDPNSADSFACAAK